MTDTPTPDTGTEAPPEHTDQQEPDTGTEPDWKAEADKWKAQARRHEERAKANAKAQSELETLRLASLSDTEKAVEIARAEARREVLAEAGAKLVDAYVRTAVSDRAVDADALLEGLDRTRFLTDDGDADQAAIAAWVDRIAPKPTGGFAPPDLGQGARGSTPLGGDALERILRETINTR